MPAGLALDSTTALCLLLRARAAFMASMVAEETCILAGSNVLCMASFFFLDVGTVGLYSPVTCRMLFHSSS